jgi:hypothetical protein
MPTVTPTSSHPNVSNDAPRAERSAPDEVAPRKPANSTLTPLDAPVEDPYDDIACTD